MSGHAHPSTASNRRFRTVMRIDSAASRSLGIESIWGARITTASTPKATMVSSSAAWTAPRIGRPALKAFRPTRAVVERAGNVAAAEDSSLEMDMLEPGHPLKSLIDRTRDRVPAIGQYGAEN